MRYVPCKSSMSVLQDSSRELAASASEVGLVITVSCPHRYHSPRSPTHPNNQHSPTLHRITRWKPAFLQLADNTTCWTEMGHCSFCIISVTPVWLSVRSEVQIVCICSSWCYCFPKPHHLLPQLNPDWFYLSGTDIPRLSWKRGH